MPLEALNCNFKQILVYYYNLLANFGTQENN